MDRRWWASFALILGLGGCAAGTKPCMVIPAQIDLARDVRDAARATLEEKKAEYQRWVQNLEQSQTKIARLNEERDQLRTEVGGATPGQATPADTSGAKSKAKEEEKKK